ncbi:MAG: class I SAM-dependent methyltransferase [Ktedonobacterales bacterium]
MESATPTYYQRLAAAYVRGTLGQAAAFTALDAATSELFATPLDDLAPDQLQAIIQAGLDSGLRLHRFKRTMGLPRVDKVLGILRGLQPDTLLDIGSGRGAFLWSLLDAFPDLHVTCADILEHRVAGIQAVHDGGVATLAAVRADATALPFADGSFDVVTLLEVLEHIPDTQSALAEVCRVARRFVVLSVPMHPDDNPEHIHLFDQRELSGLLEQQGIARVSAEHVLNHLILVARKAAL